MNVEKIKPLILDCARIVSTQESIDRILDGIEPDTTDEGLEDDLKVKVRELFNEVCQPENIQP